MKHFISLWVILFFIISIQFVYSQSNVKTWTETTVQDFADNQLSNIVINNDSTTSVTLHHPLVKTTDDYLDNSTLRFIAKDSAGNFVHAWNSTNGNIYVQKYSADGKEKTKAIRVNEGAGNIHTNSASAAILNDGTYIVMWGQNGQILKDDSIKVGNNFSINDVNGIQSGGYPIANNIGHNFLILFTIRENYPENRLYLQKIDINGKKIGELRKLNPENFTTIEYNPIAVPDKNGFWASWRGSSEDENYNDYDLGIYMRHYRFDGTPLSDVILVVPHFGTFDLCMDNNSRVLVSWEERINTIYGGGNILAQLYDSTGVTIGSKIQLNSLSPNVYIYNTSPDIDFSNNEFHISWLKWSDELNAYATYVNRWKFDPKLSGEMISSVFDGSPKGCMFEKLSWNCKSNIASVLKFQLRSANTIEQLNNSQWDGPTSVSDFYTINTGQTINSIHNGNRYIQYKAFFKSEYGNSAELNSISITYVPADTNPPNPPNNLTASNNKINVFLNWQPGQDSDVAAYKIYRGIESQKYDESWCKLVSKDVVSYTDSSALVGKKYYYAVTAIDSSHNESSFSNEALMIFRGSNYYVSENGSPTGSGSINDPVKTIQQGMDIASPGDTLKIMPGNFSDKFSFKSRVSIVGSGVNQCTLNYEIYPLDDCVVKGFTITKPVHCIKGAPIITENIIKCSGEAAVYLSADGNGNFSSAIISKNYITGCSFGIFAKNYILEPIIKNNIIKAAEIGIRIAYDGSVNIFNNTIRVSANMSFSILTGLSPCKVENNICIGKNGISSSNELSPMINYNDLLCEYPSNFKLTSTNILLDPKFVNEDVSDYHLLSNSPCKDAGNPDPVYNDEDGSRNDIGAYGGPDPFDLNIISNLTRSIYVSSLSGYPGDTIAISISMDKTSGLAKADLILDYNSNLLNFINAKLTQATKNFNLEQKILSSNEMELTMSSTSGATDDSKDILLLNFIVNPLAKTNDASALTLKEIALTDTASKAVYLRSLTSGAFVVNNTSESKKYIYVDSKNSGTEDGNRKHPFKTITAGINKAESGDTVLVAGGNYYEVLKMKEGVALIGSGSSVTNIIGIGDNYGILFDNVTQGEISGFTFKTDNEHLLMGSFIICHSASPIIKKNRFETELFENTVILCEDNSSPVIENNYLNNADIFINNSTPVIKNNFIKSFMWGIKCAANSNAEISRNTIIGMINAIQIYQSNATVKNNFIYCGVGQIGILINYATGAKIYSNIIKDNTNAGKGIRIYESQNTEVINNTINTKKIGIEEIASPSSIFNNIIINNLYYGIDYSDATQIDYNAFWNNAINYRGLNPVQHDILGDILFADTSKENYRLLSNSPCINAGNPDPKYNDIDGSRNDIGAYGGPFADSSWINPDGSNLSINQVTEKDTIQIFIKGEKIEGIAGINLGLSYDPSVLTLLTASAADLTKSFSVEKTNLKSGSVSLALRSNKGITDKEGGLIELQFAALSPQRVTTTLHVDSAAVWDETECSKSILDIKGGQLTVITGIEKISNELPKTYSLSQNYPNPFNPATKIRFEIPTEEKVTIKIYDILGREVSTLLNEIKKPGRYEFEWNAKNYASGVYIYSLTGGKNFLVKKMMLVK